MKKKSKLTDSVPRTPAPPDFDNLLAVLSRRRPKRPTLFEFFMNRPLYLKLAAGDVLPAQNDALSEFRLIARAFQNAGYDYVTAGVPGFSFPAGEARHASTRSMNEGFVINDRRAFDAYEWQDPAAANYELLDRMAEELPKGMKVIVFGPGGVLENVMGLVGYDNICYMALDDEALAFDICGAVGSRLAEYYNRCVKHPSVGAIIGNDDWGFKSQTMLAPAHMRKFVFPWHKEIVRAAHAAGKPAILHSCGQLKEVMDDVIRDMKYDARHSYEDAIQPVESAYDEYGGRIAILGGIDMDFMCRSTPEAVYERSAHMLAKAEQRGAYALGTGNSVPEYLPDENYFAMIRAALDLR